MGRDRKADEAAEECPDHRSELQPYTLGHVLVPALESIHAQNAERNPADEHSSQGTERVIWSTTHLHALNVGRREAEHPGPEVHVQLGGVLVGLRASRHHCSQAGNDSLDAAPHCSHFGNLADGPRDRLITEVVVRVISRRRLREFSERWPDAAEPLNAWYRVVTHATYATPQEVKDQFRNASFIGGTKTAFNIGGNKYRLVVDMRYDLGRIYVRHVLTHEEYDRRSDEDTL
jgi:mRNA interferase HigB